MTTQEISLHDTKRVVRPWAMLALGVAAQTAGTIFVSAPAFLIPQFQQQFDLDLVGAGALATAPTLGLVFTLVLWGAFADRYGERLALTLGLAFTAVAAAGVLFASSAVALWVLFVLGGMASASTNAASGRVVVGWFARERRGLAMGVRQIAQPLGVTVAAVTVPSLAVLGGIPAASVPAVLLTAVLAGACWFGIVNPPRVAAADELASSRAVSPYKQNSFLWRIHVVALLLVIPQFTLTTFGLVWLVSELEWSALAAGVVIGIAQFVGALGRIVLGSVSDRMGSRVALLRRVAWLAAAVMLLLAIAAAVWGNAPIVIAAILVVATTVSVADNGLTFTSVAEGAGSAWAGRAFGIHNTGQYIAATAVGPVVGGLVALLGFPLAFAAVALAPVLSVPFVPRRDVDALGVGTVPSR